MLAGSVQHFVFLAARWWFVAQGVMTQVKILKTTITTQNTAELPTPVLLLTAMPRAHMCESEDTLDRTADSLPQDLNTHQSNMWRIRFLLPWFDCKHVKIWRGRRIQWKLFAKTRRRWSIKSFVWTDTEKNSKGNSSRFPRHVVSWTFVSQSIYTVLILLLYFFSDFILTLCKSRAYRLIS